MKIATKQITFGYPGTWMNLMFQQTFTATTMTAKTASGDKMSDLQVTKHKVPIRPIDDGRLNYGSGPCKVIMRGGKMLEEPEIILQDYPALVTLWEVQKNKKTGKK